MSYECRERLYLLMERFQINLLYTLILSNALYVFWGSII